MLWKEKHHYPVQQMKKQMEAIGLDLQSVYFSEEGVQLG